MDMFLKVIHIWQNWKVSWVKKEWKSFSAKTQKDFQRVFKKNSWNECGINKSKQSKTQNQFSMKIGFRKQLQEVIWHVYEVTKMAEKFGIGSGPHELKIGNSFIKNKGQFHTIKYDFKPASLDPTAVGSVEIGDSNSLSVKVPHSNGSTETQYR